MKSETDWFYKAKWGVFCHYLADEASTAIQTHLTAEQWNKRIDEFDVDGLAAQLASAGAKYFCITLGQNSGFYIAPNSTYDDLVGILPSKLSNRDLISDLAVALAPFGISLMVYFTGSAPANEPQAIKKLKCTPPWDARLLGLNPDIYSSEEAEQTDDRLSKFQQYWEAIIREWSLRWGGKVKGWFIDGVYCADKMYRNSQEPNFSSFKAALKAGNPSALVAFNPGLILPRVITQDGSQEEFSFGELDFALPVNGRWYDGTPAWSGRFIEDAQFQMFTFLGEWWGKGEPRFPDELVIGYTKHVNAHQGVMTWDVPISQKGLIPMSFLKQLEVLDQAIK